MLDTASLPREVVLRVLSPRLGFVGLGVEAAVEEEAEEVKAGSSLAAEAADVMSK